DPNPQGSRGKPPPFLDELYTLFGRTTHDRGNLISVGGVREPPRSYGSHDTPDDGNSEMSSTEDSSHSHTASDDSSNIFQQAGAAAVLAAFNSRSYTLVSMINLPTPLPHMTGRQWVELNMRDFR
ncbi:hypothetical protein ACJX0J_041952, partial [Zea mays]